MKLSVDFAVSIYETLVMRTNILDNYRIENGFTYKDLAEHLGFPKLRVYRWCKDLSEPRKSERPQIEEKTNGTVVFGGFQNISPACLNSNCELAIAATRNHPEHSIKFLHVTKSHNQKESP